MATGVLFIARYCPTNSFFYIESQSNLNLLDANGVTVENSQLVH